MDFLHKFNSAYKISASLPATLFLLACSPAPQTGDPDGLLIVGNDRDAHGCIGSAGYQWSSLREECIRLFETGIALTPTDGENQVDAYLIPADNDDAIELSLFNVEDGIILQSKGDSWIDRKNTYRLTQSPEGQYTLSDAAGKLLFQSAATTQSEPEQEPEGDEIREFGKIVAIEDSGYPSYSVDVEFPERKFTQSFYLNVEATPLDASQLDGLVGKFATILYTSDMENFLLDMQFGGKSIFGGDAIETDPEFRSAEGILSGAEEPSAGDLPDEISVTTDTGEKLEFEFFITEEMAAQNGKRVTVSYDERPMHRIVNMETATE